MTKTIYNFDELYNIIQNNERIAHPFEIDFDIKKYGGALLRQAVENNAISQVIDLLELGADVNSRNGGGRTALFYCKSPQMVKLLLGAGADTSIRCFIDYSAYGYIAKYALSTDRDGNMNPLYQPYIIRDLDRREQMLNLIIEAEIQRLKLNKE